MSHATTEATTVPEVNDLVFVRVGDLVRFKSGLATDDTSSRVEDVVTDPASGRVLGYVLAAPMIPAPDPGTPLSLLWLMPRGVGVLPLDFTSEIRTEHGLRLWHAAVTGPASREQRRRFVRIPLSLPTQVRIRGGVGHLIASAARPGRASGPTSLEDLPEVISCLSTNVSEGGMLLTSSEHVLPAEAPLTCDFTIDGRPLHLDARVVWSVGERTRGTMVVETAVAFENGGKQVDELRRLVFQWQLRERRRSD